MPINNETLGQSAEKVICDLSKIDSFHLIERSNETYANFLNYKFSFIQLAILYPSLGGTAFPI